MLNKSLFNQLAAMPVMALLLNSKL